MMVESLGRRENLALKGLLMHKKLKLKINGC
jgi:hypothetical protein